MGDWTYYVTVMSAGDLVKHVGFAEEVCPNTGLDLMIQREVSARASQIADYLRHNEQRFFGSLIVAAYNGKPQFIPISFGDPLLYRHIEGKFGFLQFDGSEQYYAVDGQHRLAAFKEVIDENSERYKSDEVSVIVICHARDAEGMARARRLFTTVNRYAKKTSPVTDIVMDEDDGTALVTRRLIREQAFFRVRIKILVKAKKGAAKLATGEAMQEGDVDYLMAIGTFYKCNQALIPEAQREAFSRMQQVPSFDDLETAYTALVSRWEQLIQIVPLWASLKDENSDVGAARSSSGGNIFARPVGIVSFVRAASRALERGVDVERIKRAILNFSNLAESPWIGVLWNPTSRRMIAGREAENLAADIWSYLFGIADNIEDIERSWRSKVDPEGQRQDLHLPVT